MWSFCMLGIWKRQVLQNLYPSELVSNGYISIHNKVRRPRPKFKVSFYLYFCCFWINATQINFENIKRKIQRIIFDSCFQLKSRFNVDARAPSIPLLNFPFKNCTEQAKWKENYTFQLLGNAFQLQSHLLNKFTKFIYTCLPLLCCFLELFISGFLREAAMSSSLFNVICYAFWKDCNNSSSSLQIIKLCNSIMNILRSFRWRK